MTWIALLAGQTSVAAETSSGNLRTVRETWHDLSRDRDVPVLIYLPVNSSAVPTILFSHGLGGSRDGYSYLGRYWAAHGYVCVHVQHLGSDSAIFGATAAGTMANAKRAAADPKNAIDRCKDISFAIDKLTALNADPASPLHGRIDLAHLGMAGHSFGGHTTMAIAGQVAVWPGKTVSMADPRISAAIAMSAPVPANRSNAASAYAPIHIPIFLLTGTDDNSPIGGTRSADRRLPFDNLRQGPAFLAIFQGGDHMLFSGRRAAGRVASNDDRYHALIQQSTTLFWDAYLRGDGKARASISDGSLAKSLAGAATFEAKVPDDSHQHNRDDP